MYADPPTSITSSGTAAAGTAATTTATAGRRVWRRLAVRGALSVVFGTVAMLWTDATVTVLVVLFGACAIADGVLALRAAARGATSRWSAVAGLVSIALGCAAVAWPSMTAPGLAVLIGIWLVVGGLEDVVASVRAPRGSPGRGLFALGGAAGALGGLYLVVFPDRGALALVYVIGLIAVVRGTAAIGAAFAARHDDVAASELASVVTP